MLRTIYSILLLLSLSGCDQLLKKPIQQSGMTVPTGSQIDHDIRIKLERSISLSERKLQENAIRTLFSYRTSHDRATRLAALCYSATLETPFMPFDLAEIALAETGGHQLSRKAVSSKGALGVWQLMPYRAKSHGYSPQDMLNDEKCAEAAVRELFTKLDMAKGNLDKAKKLYCGQGAQANAYMKKILKIRKQLVGELNLQREYLAMNTTPGTTVR